MPSTSSDGNTISTPSSTPKHPAYPLPYETPSTLANIPVSLPHLPPSSSLPNTNTLVTHANSLLSHLSSSTPPNSIFTASTTPLFRDLHALTSSIRTFYSAQSILQAWTTGTALRQATKFQLQDDTLQVNKLPGGVGWVDVMFSFTCDAAPATNCEGYLSIVPETNEHKGATEWKIWIIRTILKDFVDGPSVDFLHSISQSQSDASPTSNNSSPVSRGSHNASVNGNSATDNTNSANVNALPSKKEIDVLIIGAGPAGLSLSSRLLALDIPFLTISRDPPSSGIGSSWSTRVSHSLYSKTTPACRCSSQTNQLRHKPERSMVKSNS